DREGEGGEVDVGERGRVVGESLPSERRGGELENPPARASTPRTTSSSEVTPDETITALSHRVRRRRWIARDRERCFGIWGDDVWVVDDLVIARRG
ncbi:MAG: hypothetical protein ACRDWE_10560, partial [Acidimicrobiales bacterium]